MIRRQTVYIAVVVLLYKWHRLCTINTSKRLQVLDNNMLINVNACSKSLAFEILTLPGQSRI